MTDGVIKGTGNSRYLKSVPNFMALYPTYEAFVQALIAGTLPIDLYGKNSNGWNTQGTDLNKASLLTDAAETAIWGSAANRTVSAALQQLRSIISTAQTSITNLEGSRLRATYGTFTGTGSSDYSISCPGRPLFYTATPSIPSGSSFAGMWVWIYGSRRLSSYDGASVYSPTVSSGATSLSFSHTTAIFVSGVTYAYVLISK